MAALGQSIIRNAIGLALFAVITAGTIALTHAFTQERIQDQVRQAEAGALLEILPEDLHDNDLLQDTVNVGPSDKLGLDVEAQAHIARQHGTISGVILPAVAPNGYSGEIRMLVGIADSGEVLGVRVTQHRETPGLGDKVETKKSNWIYSFNGKSLENVPSDQWAVVKDGGQFDQFTGATITPRAVVSAVHGTLQYFEENRPKLTRTEPARDGDEN
ncbi:electron transport complex subunit RsxG [Marinobacter nanhaiticus D15-8W]|uniref:Ion-translocating oxidoreductase complex subunit G n=1 Tax=Marinobacter nanhaiticus D15-8W TaxID=626887 RepID=N6VW64_9GAMM|nr:electron transport complex subunit RsxG [Marinobacter nanhaiticus]ENO14470.1 electron transport complex subunit RsxG [Marinobacter nanhaiticus D15-8W]BES71863.1 electron transport complex subunit RsxG [Marinobacter nanhaiticus D15-8W]